jgi:DNA topoisomerase III
VKLYICEKPSQAKEIAPHVGARTRGDGCITGAGVTVTWCIGHLLEQAKPDHYNPALRSWDLALLPVLPQTWEMNVKESVKKQYLVVKKLLAQASEVVIATDADREGEVIAREVMQLCKFSGSVQRLWLSALNEASVKQALSKLLPGAKTLPMYYSGLGRARADWLAGMNMTMALTTGFGVGRGSAGVLHCGRVQTPVLALIVRRERHIAIFKPTTYFELEAKFKINGMIVPMQWVPHPSLLDNHGHCRDEPSIKAVAASVRGKTGFVSQVLTTPEREQIPLLHSLGSLQREASAKYGLKAQSVLDACQALYETHKATTYPRTDCEYLPTSMHVDVIGVLESIATIDPTLVGLANQCDASSMSRAFNDKKITAHHAIIPIANSKVSLSAMKPAEKIVYGMICRRYLAQFLGEHLFDKTVMMVRCVEADFRAVGKTIRQPGWKRSYPSSTANSINGGIDQPQKAKGNTSGASAGDEAPVEVALPTAREDDEAIEVGNVVKRCATKAPKRYTEGTLLAAMESIDKEIEDPRWQRIMRNKEKAGIGTDATRSAVIENLFSREYISNQAKSIIPTQRGMDLIELIEKIAPALADPVLTAQWEDRLSQVESGELLLETFESELGTWLNRLVEQVRVQASQARKVADTQPSPSMNKPTARDVVAQESNRPTVKPIVRSTPERPTAPGVACPICGASLQRRQGAKGYFWGCNNYQQTKCRGSMDDNDGKPAAPAPIQKPAARQESPVQPQSQGNVGDGVEEVLASLACVNCAKPMQLRQSARGAFWGCSGFPGCRSTAPVMAPGQETVVAKTSISRNTEVRGKIGEKCPTCAKGTLVLKSLPQKGRGFAGCTKFPECRHFQYV